MSLRHDVEGRPGHRGPTAWVRRRGSARLKHAAAGGRKACWTLRASSFLGRLTRSINSAVLRRRVARSRSPRRRGGCSMIHLTAWRGSKDPSGSVGATGETSTIRSIRICATISWQGSCWRALQQTRGRRSERPPPHFALQLIIRAVPTRCGGEPLRFSFPRSRASINFGRHESTIECGTRNTACQAVTVEAGESGAISHQPSNGRIWNQKSKNDIRVR